MSISFHKTTCSHFYERYAYKKSFLKSITFHSCILFGFYFIFTSFAIVLDSFHKPCYCVFYVHVCETIRS